MTDIARGRWTHDHKGTLTVFVIGMRINRWLRPDAWAPVVAAMGPMISELSRDRSSGFLGGEVSLAWRGPMMIQYWRSPEDLYRYATEQDATHRPAWTAFNERARRLPGAVGVWHETYQVSRAETVYSDMPPTGLAAATAAVRVSRRMDRAETRMAAADPS